MTPALSALIEALHGTHPRWTIDGEQGPCGCAESAEAIVAHPFTDSERAAIAAAILTPEVLAVAIDNHVHGIGWDRMCTGEDCAPATLTALREAGR